MKKIFLFIGRVFPRNYLHKLLFLLQIFPYKTSASFFSTTTGTFLFILMPFIVGLTELRK